MKTLFKFLLRFGIYFYFIALEVLAFLLIVNHNYFQRSIFFATCNEVTGKLYEYDECISDYFDLKQVNQDLANENIHLRNQLFLIENRLVNDSINRKTFETKRVNPRMEYTCRSAKVVNNSTHKLQNFITINKGYKDGIRDEMSVINGQGVVGIVKNVSEHFAVVMPILNPKAQISCKIKGEINKNDSVGVVKDIGSLIWEGGDSRFACMKQVPRHVHIRRGDAIITSGYSDFFPEGILVGTVDAVFKADDDNYYDIKVRLSVNFNTLSYVEVLDYKNRTEQVKVEQLATKEQ